MNTPWPNVPANRRPLRNHTPVTATTPVTGFDERAKLTPPFVLT